MCRGAKREDVTIIGYILSFSVLKYLPTITVHHVKGKDCVFIIVIKFLLLIFVYLKLNYRY